MAPLRSHIRHQLKGIDSGRKRGDNWDGLAGFIHLRLCKHEDPSEIEYYLCGPRPWWVL